MADGVIEGAIMSIVRALHDFPTCCACHAVTVIVSAINREVLAIKGLTAYCAALSISILIALRVIEARMLVIIVVGAVDWLTTSFACEAGMVVSIALYSRVLAIKGLTAHHATLSKGFSVARRVIGPVCLLVCVEVSFNQLLTACALPAAGMPFATQCSQE